MLRVGLTGGIGCGKSIVAETFHRNFTSPVIDADTIALAVSQTPKITDLIYQRLGAKYLDHKRRLLRDRLRLAVFSDPKTRYELESILHPPVYEEINRQLDKLNEEYCLVVIPLLLEARWTNLVNRILVVDCKVETQIQRVMQRDQCSKAHVEAIIATQISRHERLKLADDVIENHGDIKSLDKKIALLDEKYRVLSKISSA